MEGGREVDQHRVTVLAGEYVAAMTQVEVHDAPRVHGGHGAPQLVHEGGRQRTRERTRRLGKRLPKALISRTLLIKGMEFDHAVVLDADGLNRKEFYVAATRASRSLTILSSRPVLPFATA